jgi:uncharacterized membrane protein
MGLGCMITVVATFLQTFPPAKGTLACFMVGRVFIGVGTAFATSEFTRREPLLCTLLWLKV